MAVEVLTNADVELLIQRTVDATLSKLEKLHRVPPLMNKAQVAEYLGKSTATIDRYMREGMPFRKIHGGYPEFYRPDIDAWLNERFREQI
jgi:predicted DNA-binding transcriptional regulator AlpA